MEDEKKQPEKAVDQKPKRKRKPKAQGPTVDHEKQYKDHQEFCSLRLQYVNLTPEGKKKFTKKSRMEELEKLVKAMEGPKAKTAKKQGIAKLGLNGAIIYISQGYNNPALVVAKFTPRQRELYFLG